MVGPSPVARNRLVKMAEAECLENSSSIAANFAESRTFFSPIFLNISLPYRKEIPYQRRSPATHETNAYVKISSISKYPCDANAPAAMSNAVAGSGSQSDAEPTTATSNAYFQMRR